MFPNLGPIEMIMVMGVAVLLFGKRLPEVGRSLGKGIVEFKKGIRGIEDEFDISGPSSRPSRRTEDRHRSSDSSETAVPKFEPPSGAPVPQMEYEPQATPHD
jgi:sec-independent protein translocase protein TatA